MKKKLIKALAFLTEGKGFHLGNDTFLTNYLDGADKIYGFGLEDGVLIVHDSSSGYPVSDMDKDDLDYIFNLSAPNIYKKILNKEYEVMENDYI